MADGWGGARPGADRKSYAHIKECREHMQGAVTAQDWSVALKHLMDMMKGTGTGDGPIKPRESIEVGKLLMRHAFAIPQREQVQDDEDQRIRLTQIHHPCEQGDCLFDGDPRFITEHGQPLSPDDPLYQKKAQEYAVDHAPAQPDELSPASSERETHYPPKFARVRPTSADQDDGDPIENRKLGLSSQAQVGDPRSWNIPEARRIRSEAE